jgi:dipeptidase E
MESGNPLLDEYVLGLCCSERPKICFLPSASGDADHYVVRFYRAFPAERCEASHISLFRREQGPEDLRSHLLSQDLIYVGGGSVVSLLGVWRAHGIDQILREAWEAGVVLCGLSAGSLCWFDEAVTGFHGAPQRVEGLGLLPFSNCVHYEATSARRLAYHEMLRAGMRPGYAAEDSAGLHFIGCELHRVIASRPAARGYRLDGAGDRVIEMRLATAYLGDAPQVTRLPGTTSSTLSASSAA